MKLEVLMSVMHQDNFDIAYKSKINSDLLIINQCDRDDFSEIEVDGHKWRMISTTERGVARSRQMALDNTRADICLFGDDDEVLFPNYVETIINAYKELEDAGSIVFNVDRVGYKMKKKYYRIKKIRIAPMYRGYSTQMLTIKRKEVLDTGVKMNFKFGSGSEWGGGEETLFEQEIRQAGIKMYEYPETIATIHYEEGSDWFHGYNEKYFYNLGAYSGYVCKGKIKVKTLLSWFYTCFYKLRKEKYLNPFAKLKWMCRGFKGIQKDVTYRQYLELHPQD